MVTSLEQLDKVLNSMGSGGDEPPVTNQQRNAWNQYVQYLQKRGIAGDPKLDRNGLGKNLFLQYIKDNPNTGLTEDSPMAIQHDFANYRQWAINQIKSGKGEYAPGTDENTFMKELSQIDGYAGSKTTRHLFPKSYMQTFEDGKKVKTEDRGFATTSTADNLTK